jgi:hypothetical protein
MGLMLRAEHEIADSSTQVKETKYIEQPRRWTANIIFVATIHALALLSLIWHRPHYNTLIMCLILWQAAGLGIIMYVGHQATILCRCHNGVSSVMVTSLLRGQCSTPTAPLPIGNYGLSRLDSLVGLEASLTSSVRNSDNIFFLS